MQQNDTARNRVRYGWSAALSKAAGAIVLFELLSGLAITFGPFRPAIEWNILPHTIAGVITIAPLAWYCVRHWKDYQYIDWRHGDLREASAKLSAARNARGPEWKPSGSVLEGDVRQRMFRESGFLNVFERQSDGSEDPRRAYAPLDVYLLHLW